MPNLHPDPQPFRTHIGEWDNTHELIMMRNPSGRSDLRSWEAMVVPFAEYERLVAHDRGTVMISRPDYEALADQPVTITLNPVTHLARAQAALAAASRDATLYVHADSWEEWERLAWLAMDAQRHGATLTIAVYNSDGVTVDAGDDVGWTFWMRSDDREDGPPIVQELMACIDEVQWSGGGS